MVDKFFEFFLVRHGRSLGQDNVNSYKSIGDHGLPLTKMGEEQAHAAGEFLNFYTTENAIDLSAVFTSSCKRAKDTAQILSVPISQRTFLPILEDGRLDKQKFGLFDGMLSNKERKTKYPDEYQNFQLQVESNGLISARPPGGESISDVYERAASFIDEDTFSSRSSSVIVTHGLVALCIEKRLMGLSDEWLLQKMDKMKNCEVRRIYGSSEGIYTETLCDDPISWKKYKDSQALTA